MKLESAESLSESDRRYFYHLWDCKKVYVTAFVMKLERSLNISG